MYISFIDLTVIRQNTTQDFISCFRCTPRMQSLLKEIYTGTTAIITGSRKSFQIETGCRQGGIESPVLFNIHFDTVCRVLNYELKRVLGDDYGIKFSYRIPNEATSRTRRSKCRSNGISSINYALYADDMYSIFRTKSALQKGMNIVEEIFTLSRKKTETMVVNGEDDDTNSELIITLGNQKIKNVKEFKYLGVMIALGDPEAMIKLRIASTSSKFSEIKDLLTNHRINIKTRGKFMNALS